MTINRKLFGIIVLVTVFVLVGVFAFAQGQIPANFVRVQGGTFQMGSTAGGNETPVHTVTVKSFSIGKYEVTQKEWYEVMGMTIRQQRDMVDSSRSLCGEGDNYPMYFVNWYEAVEYCNRRSIKEGLTPAYRGSGDNITCDWDANGYRLPTEAEWEYAARGGNGSPGNYTYAGSNNVDAVAWYSGNNGSRGSADYGAKPVGKKAANGLGLHDMSGNILEWCWDWYAGYPNRSETDPRGWVNPPATVIYRVMRGGSWYTSASDARATGRWHRIPSDTDSTFGFRVVRP